MKGTADEGLKLTPADRNRSGEQYALGDEVRDGATAAESGAEARANGMMSAGDNAVAPSDAGTVRAEVTVSGESGTKSEVVAQSATTLVEVAPGIAAVFGEVPEGLELLDLDLAPPRSRAALYEGLGALGNTLEFGGTVLGAFDGGAVQVTASAQGLCRLAPATLAKMADGAKLAPKDGANLGALIQPGKGIVGQARFIPVGDVTMTIQQLAPALGPQMLAAFGQALVVAQLQAQLAEMTDLLQHNLALTKQTLKLIRSEQWSELEGLVQAINEAVDESRKVGSVTESTWGSVEANRALLYKQKDLYRKNVADHIKELGRLDGVERRQYLEDNGEAIVFDAYAMLNALKAYAGYEMLRGARANQRGIEEESEAQLAKQIARELPERIEEGLGDTANLVQALRRELKIIAQLPGRAQLPLGKRHKDAKAVKLTCEELVKALDPLADRLLHSVAELEPPELLCVPEGVELEKYLKLLRWHLEYGEELQALAFASEVGDNHAKGKLPLVMRQRVDAAWVGLMPGVSKAVLGKITSPTLVAVTDRRLIVGDEGRLLREGMLDRSVPLDDIRWVRPPEEQQDRGRDAITVYSKRGGKYDLDLVFAERVEKDRVERFTGAIGDAVTAFETAQKPAEPRELAPGIRRELEQHEKSV
jgi:hypothetical protein